MDKTSLTLGWLVGRRIAGQRSKKTLVAYLYNGAQLPPLPEWDEEIYPYACIVQSSSTGYQFHAFSQNAGYTNINWGSGYGYFGSTTSNVYENVEAGYGIDRYAEEWPELRSTCGRVLCENIIWANFDVRDASGVILAASEPALMTKPKKWADYLYNGVKLPELPDYDKETYQYAYISCASKYDPYILRLSAGKIAKYNAIYAKVPAPSLRYKQSGAGWVLVSENSEDYNIFVSADNSIWSNHDILNTDGTILFGVCADPIPVYDTT